MTVIESTPDCLTQLRNLDLDQLRELFWALARRTVEPLARFAAEHTTPSIEQADPAEPAHDGYRTHAAPG